MQPYLEKALDLQFPPLAIYYTDILPENVKLQPVMCSMFLVAQAVKGKTVALSKDSCRCHGAASGFGLSKMDPEEFPGGSKCFLRFLSIGNESWEQGKGVLEHLKAAGAPKILIEEFAEGEGFCKTPELVEDWVNGLPEAKPEGAYVILKPLSKLEENETPKVVSLLVNPDQLSALVVLANYARKGCDNVRIPFGAGCNCFGLYPFAEVEKEAPCAIVGLTDISARFYLNKALGRDILSFTVPYTMYEEMVNNASDSFLSRYAWRTIMK